MSVTDGFASGLAGTLGRGTTEDVPSTGTGLQTSRDGRRPRSSRIPLVIVTQSRRWLSVEALTAIRSSNASVLSIRVLAGSDNAARTAANLVFCSSVQECKADRLLG